MIVVYIVLFLALTFPFIRLTVLTFLAFDAYFKTMSGRPNPVRTTTTLRYVLIFLILLHNNLWCGFLSTSSRFIFATNPFGLEATHRINIIGNIFDIKIESYLIPQ